ncbi:MAG: efflux RND transporter periplasmic adaptor subunit [Isosphaeraceae bacterium]
MSFQSTPRAEPIMPSNLREELASLKIERDFTNGRVHDQRGRRTEGGVGFLALLIWLIPLGLLGTAGVYGYRQYEQLRAKVEVNVGVVQTMTPGEAEKLLSAKGYLKSRFQAMIGAKIPGRVEKMYVAEGSKVKKGDVLAVLEHNEMKAYLAARKAMILQTEAQLLEAKIDQKEKEREAIRARRLQSKRMLSQEDMEKAEALQGMSVAKVKALEAGLQLQTANVSETEENIRYMSIFAPFDGTVVEKQGEEGEVITPSAMSSSIGRSAVVTLASLGKMEVETDISETLLSRVALGQPAEVSVSAVPNKHYQGRLRQIIPMGDRTRGTVKVKVEILDPDASLFPELVATVHFLPDKGLKNPNASRSFLFVPKAALVEQNGHTYAWVIDTKSRSSLRQVEVAPTNDELARVESGLKSGEMVVLNPPKGLRENETVKVAE